jgi:hypothetical protein
MEPLLEQQQNTFHITFDSVSDLLDTMRSLESKYPQIQRRMDWIVRNHPDFIGRGIRTSTQGCDLVEQSWDEGLRIYDTIMNQLHDEHIPPPKSLKRRGCWSEEDGSEINIDRLREGEPYWRSTKREHRPGPISITILSGISTSCGVDWKDIIYRGAATICLTELLETAGYRVELWSVRYATEAYINGWNNLSCVCLKYGSDPLDVGTLINATSGWAFRSVWVPAQWLADVAAEDGYGTPASFDRYKHLITPDEQVIICENIWNHSAAVRWIRSEIEKLK